jgi:hypothetical protein
MPNLLPRPLHPTLRPNIHQQVFLPRLPLLSFDLFFLLVTFDHGRCELGAEVGCVEGVEGGEGGGGYLRVDGEWVGLEEGEGGKGGVVSRGRDGVESGREARVERRQEGDCNHGHVRRTTMTMKSK